MNNLFEKAYFSKPYKTRDGRKAIYIGESTIDKGAVLIVYEDSISTHRIMKDGHYWATPNVESGNDIVSELEDDEPDYTMTKEELEQKAFDAYCNGCKYCEGAKTMEERYEACQQSICYRKTYVWKLINGYQRGYSDAMKEISQIKL